MLQPASSRAPASGGLFLGGLFSGLLLALAYPPHTHRLVPWFALVPFFISLDRNRERPFRRCVHAFSFALSMALVALQPLFQATLSEAEEQGGLSVSAVAAVTVRNAALWCVLGLFTGVFAATSGFILRQRSAWWPLVALPLLWSGLEHLRLECLPRPIPWLALGQSIDPALPESQIAAVFGVYGISMAIVLANTAFFLVLRQQSAAYQAAFAVLGCAVFLAVNAYGRLSGPIPADDARIRVGLVQTESRDATEVLRLAESILSLEPDLVIFPARVLTRKDPAAANPIDAVRGFARENRVDVCAGIDGTALTPARPGDGEVQCFNRDGELVGSYPARTASSFLGPAANAAGAPPLLATAGVTFGLGVEADFDAPAEARRRSAAGAKLLVSTSSENRASGQAFALVRSRLQGLRAVENRRWLVCASRGGQSLILDPWGRARHGAPVGQGAAIVEFVSAVSATSPYTRWGWLAGPASLGAASVLTLVALAARVRRR